MFEFHEKIKIKDNNKINLKILRDSEFITVNVSKDSEGKLE